MFSSIFLFLLLNISILMVRFTHTRCFWRMKQNENKEGDLGTGCVFPIRLVPFPVEEEYFSYILNTQTPTKNYQFALALAFSINEVNKNADLLPNMSLVFDIFEDSCMSTPKLKRLMHLSETNRHRISPNYVCDDEITCSVLLTGPKWKTSWNIRTIMELYIPQQILQLTYGPFHPMLSDSDQFPYLYQMAPKDTSLALAMVSIIIHFLWNWVGLAISDDDQGIQFLSYLRTEMEKNTACLAFVNMIPVNMQLYMSRAEVYYNQIMTSSANVVIIYGDTDSTLAVSFRMWESRGIQRIWVTTSQWDVTTSKRDFTLDSFHGTFAFAQHHSEISGFKNFLQTLNPLKYSDTYLAGLEWMHFNCKAMASKTVKNFVSNATLEWLKEQTFDMAFSDNSYNIYNAVYAVAYALPKLLLQRVDNPTNGKGPISLCLKMYSVLKKTLFTNPVGDTVNMNQKKKCQAEYDIFYIWNLPYDLELKWKIGKFSPHFQQGQQLHLSEDMLEWTTGGRQMPVSVCSADCGPGFRKFWQQGMPPCCFDCSPCPENEISNDTNLDQCVKCPEDQYANPEHNQCIQRAVVFLGYEEPLGMALAIMSLCFSVFTAIVLGVFVKHHATPIVKANNCTLSYILLISLIFCFLCSLLFIGHPNSVTCILQQITFGVVFTVAVSSVLAKTITVVLAFKLTIPERKMKYILVSGTPNYIIPICTLIQMILCAIWLGVAPPSIDIDAHSEHGRIIIVCNKGSVIAFYCVLGYHGSLALGTFTLAFLARKLPDTFNEAKYLTFSMLLFCTVWVTFLPVYHSTKGKVMVTVEIFSILASSAGLLGCIFIPKCYVILLRPERNSFKNLRKKTSS
ncbi:vomeronasal type-2 receptor 116-like [Meriones unguiculatus]|uniref:vomeronasal type-2 receptor 116-like n=1 Tax=Meriones unguiculatus TaxID=10047 RepID=UPI000B4EEE89|nr:vomeronasal type-2 receptor 116-like [Meriones unguiculatus]